MKNQKGFSALEALLILVIIGILGGTGWYVWSSKNKTDQALNNAANSSVNETTAKTKNSTTLTAEKKYLEVPELGVKFELSKDIEDAYYDKSDRPSVINLRVHSLDKFPQCKSNELSVAGLIKGNKNEPDQTGKTAAETGTFEGQRTVIIGEDFYYIGLAQYSCSGGADQDNLLNNVRKAFAAASPTIVKM